MAHPRFRLPRSTTPYLVTGPDGEPRAGYVAQQREEWEWGTTQVPAMERRRRNRVRNRMARASRKANR